LKKTAFNPLTGIVSQQPFIVLLEKNPEQFGIQLQDSSTEEIIFAQNDRMFTDTVQTPHDELGDGLKRALYNYMHGLGFDLPLSSWFEIKVPKTTIPKHFIKKAIAS
jgi:hypothetical protein